MSNGNDTTSSGTAPEVSHTLPEEVITCLQNARFLHLATTSNNIPHISLMNYTYFPSTPYTTTPTIIMTTPPSSRKTANLLTNPLVSLLVHDWISHRPSSARTAGRSGSLAELLIGMNTASLSRISCTINGVAELVPAGSEQETWCKARHLENNTFGPEEDAYSSSPVDVGGGLWPRASAGAGQQQDEQREGDGGTRCYVEGEEVRVVVVKIKDGRIADWKGQVRDFVVQEGEVLANGV